MLLPVALQKDNEATNLEPLKTHHDTFNHPSQFVRP